MIARFAFATLVGVFLISLRPAATADVTDGISLKADEVSVDETFRTVTAVGNVELRHFSYVLRSERVTFDSAHDTVVASGSVVLEDSSGTTIHADQLEVTGDFREAVITNMQTLLAGGGWQTAARATRTDGRYTILRDSKFSTCRPCSEDESDSVIWQIRAREVEHDEATKRITYHDASLEFFGVPVFYLPFFSHPDPQAVRQSGFLPPVFGHRPIPGAYVGVPYYFSLASHRDLTIATTVFERTQVMLDGEFRQRARNGYFEVRGSAINTDIDEENNRPRNDDHLRWHVDGHGLWAKGEQLQYGFNLRRSSDKTYRSQYGWGSEGVLKSDAFVAFFRDRSHASISGVSYQDLRPDASDDQISTILPLVELNYLSPAMATGGSLSLNASALSLDRREGRDVNRLSMKATWAHPWLSRSGHLLTANAALRGDAYLVEKPSTSMDSAFDPRFVPELSLEWRYPLVRVGHHSVQTIEPTVLGVWSDDYGELEEIPNDDSLGNEFDENNLFRTSKFPGADRVRTGLRLNYGVRLSSISHDDLRKELVIGQSWRVEPDSKDPLVKDGRSSDFVGRLLLGFSRDTNLSYRFRFSPEQLNRSRVSLDTRAGDVALGLDYDYIRGDDENRPDHQQIALSTSVPLHEYWKLSGTWRSDLFNRNRFIYGGSITYEDECLFFAARGEHRETDTRNDDHGTEFSISINLKTSAGS